MRKVRARLWTEIASGAPVYLVGLFLFLAGVFAGAYTYRASGVSLGYGAPAGVWDALFCASAPFCLLLVSALGLPGLIVQAGTLIWCGAWLGCAPSFPACLILALIQLPCLFYLFRACFVFSVKWCRIKGTNLRMRLGGISVLFRPFLVCTFLCAAVLVTLALI